jgi:hypothetical protein
VAKGLGGMQGDAAVLGVGFCANIDKEVKSKGNGTVGLLPQLTTEWQKRCAGYVPAPAVASGAAKPQTMTLSEKVLVSTSWLSIKIDAHIHTDKLCTRRFGGTWPGVLMNKATRHSH